MATSLAVAANSPHVWVYEAGTILTGDEGTAMGAEYIPVDAYRLLRQLHVNKKVRIPTGGIDDENAVGFLVTRGLVEKTDDGMHIVATNEGMSVGRLTRSAG